MVLNMPSTTPDASGIHGCSTTNTPGKSDRHLEMALVENDPYCPLLELPAELRNRIYHLAREIEFDSDEKIPRLKKGAGTAKDSSSHAWQFFALTQTCRQLRTEYRPMWLRDCSVCIEFTDFPEFVTDFYSFQNNYHNAPKKLLISCDDRVDDTPHILFDLSPLLLLQASSPTFEAKFVSSVLLDPELLECWDCGHLINCEDVSDCDHDGTIRHINNDYIEYHYTKGLNDIFANKNARWLQELSDNINTPCLRVELTIDFDMDMKGVTLYIRFGNGSAPSTFTKETMYSGAVQYLKDTGFLGSERPDMIDFVVGEATGKWTRPTKGGDKAIPTYDQVEICGFIDHPFEASDSTESPA
ncbi:hypothetical protein GQ44DRAFT_829418 [Phaeosphaeriaceae sp. PMI808]|nr:hypothetical protein GQ44DRAFT_829418 [Phaeosphaeriaceae sp. PMI808]